MNDLFSLENKIALITGGSRGLGLYMAEGILQAGAAKVYISSRKQKACDEAVVELNAFASKNNLKGKAVAIPADLGSRAGIEHLFAEYKKHEQKLDILVANAGATWGEAFETHPDSAFDKVMALNVRAVFSCVQLFTPLLESSGNMTDPSRILVTGSVAGITAGLSGGTYGYIASKSAVAHLAKVLAVELASRNITVNTLAPGFFPSKMSNGILENMGDAVIEGNPRKRLGVKEDIIGATVYLCSRAGNYANGIVLPLDGGSHVMGRM